MRNVEETFSIYKITNLINGKHYIGQTTKTLNQRFEQHCKSNSGCTLLKRAIKKYKKENFSVELIDTVYDKYTARDKENYWIIKSNSMSPNGYNLKTSQILSDYVGSKISNSLKGRKLTKEHIDKIIGNLSGPHKDKSLRDKMVTTKRKAQKLNKDSGFKGVCWSKQQNKWQARIRINGKDKHIGYFTNVSHAAKAYDLIAFENFGFDCYLNFPKEVDFEKC